MLDLIALAITKRNKYHLLIFGDLCSAITGLPKSLGALDNRQQRTTFESHNGRSALAAGTGAHAPHLPFAIPAGIGSIGWEFAQKRCSRQAEFHHILSCRSPVGLALRDERSTGRATIGGRSGGRCRRLFAADGRGRRGHARGAAGGAARTQRP